MKEILWNIIEQVRVQSPLVQNITNYVVMNNTANALLAVGASPIMSHAHEEIYEMVRLCQSLVINIGTLDKTWNESMVNAAQSALEYDRPWILDPVGMGATILRNEMVRQLVALKPKVIRGNATEILSLAYHEKNAKGVDSSNLSEEAIQAGISISQKYNTVVCISGKNDFIIQDDKLISLSNGHEMMKYVTGLGCSSTAIIGACLAVEKDAFLAAAAGMSLLSIAGELAEKYSSGPGSLQAHILDELYNMNKDKFENCLNISNV